jgi:hypothetical protein
MMTMTRIIGRTARRTSKIASLISCIIQSLLPECRVSGIPSLREIKAALARNQ